MKSRQPCSYSWQLLWALLQIQHLSKTWGHSGFYGSIRILDCISRWNQWITVWDSILINDFFDLFFLNFTSFNTTNPHHCFEPSVIGIYQIFWKLMPFLYFLWILSVTAWSFLNLCCQICILMFNLCTPELYFQKFSFSIAAITSLWSMI